MKQLLSDYDVYRELGREAWPANFKKVLRLCSCWYKDIWMAKGQGITLNVELESQEWLFIEHTTIKF